MTEAQHQGTPDAGSGASDGGTRGSSSHTRKAGSSKGWRIEVMPGFEKGALQCLAEQGIDLSKVEVVYPTAQVNAPPPDPTTPAAQALLRLMPVWGNSKTPRTVDGAPYPAKVDTSAVMACMEAGAQFRDRTAEGLAVLQAAVRLGNRDLLAALFTSSHNLTSKSKTCWQVLLRDSILGSQGLRVSPHNEDAAQLWALGSMAFPEFVAQILVNECTSGAPQIMQGLLQLGADANSRDASKLRFTLLHHLSNPLKIKAPTPSVSGRAFGLFGCHPKGYQGV
jgi:hypothetical protein